MEEVGISGRAQLADRGRQFRRKYSPVLLVLWTGIIIVFFTYTIHASHEARLEQAKIEARTYYQLNLAYRELVSNLGGVYAPIDKVSPNPYLKAPNRDIRSSDGRNLTLINPAYMSRLAFETLQSTYNVPIRSKLTSLKYLNPENAPSPWERQALLSFEQGETEATQITSISSEPFLLLIKPLKTEQSCLRCHGHQGYTVGDIRGGISIAIPLGELIAAEGDERIRVSIAYFSIWFVGVASLLTFSHRRYTQEQQTIENEWKFRTIAETTNDWEFWLTAEGTIIFMSPSCKEETGYTPEEFIADPGLLPSLVHPDDRDRWNTHVRNIRDPLHDEIEFRIIARDGTVKWISHTCAPMHRDGRFIGRHSNNRNITERRRAEEELRHRTQGLQTLLEVSRNLATTLDLEVVLQTTTDGVTKLFGLDTAAIYLLDGDVLRLGATTPPLPPGFPEDLRNAPLSDHPHIRKTITSGEPVLVPDMRVAHLTPAERAVREQRGLRTVLFFPLVAGVKSVGTLIIGSREKPRVITDSEIETSRTLANLAALAVENARLYESRKQYADRLKQQITEHRKLEDQYRQAQKMESIGTLAGGVAHDFNNVLTAVIGYGHTALMKMAKDDPNRLNVEQILEAADRAAHLTKDLLLFSRKQAIERTLLDLNDVVRRLEKFITRVIGEDIKCATRLHQDGLPVLADRHQLEQVLMNLATNARDAMPKGGTLSIATSAIVMSEQFPSAQGYGKPGRYALLTISDNGSGMDAEVRKRIFEPFYTTKEVGKGTGLGLAVAYGIVTQHEGYINVDSEPGRGATFDIYLPLAASGGSELRLPSALLDLPGGSETILLAEDDAVVRRMTETLLKDFGYTVITAVDGVDAVEKYRESAGRIQLLLFDLIMPKKNGKEAYDEIKGTAPGVRVLFASGYSPDIIRDKASLGDGADIIYKPATPGDLLRKIRSMLDW